MNKRQKKKHKKMMIKKAAKSLSKNGLISKYTLNDNVYTITFNKNIATDLKALAKLYETKRCAETIEQLNTPTEYRITGGMLTPYACPTCNMLFHYKQAMEIRTCPGCNQKLIFKDIYAS